MKPILEPYEIKAWRDEFVEVFNFIAENVHTTAVEKGWWEEERSDVEAICLMMTELAEAVEGYRKDLQDDHLPEFKSIEVEFADCIIRIMDLAVKRGYRVPEALIAKAEYNKTREYRHGGKRA